MADAVHSARRWTINSRNAVCASSCGGFVCQKQSCLLPRSWRPLEVWRPFVFCSHFMVSLKTRASQGPLGVRWGPSFHPRLSRCWEAASAVWTLPLPGEPSSVLLSGRGQGRGGDKARWLLAQVRMEPACGQLPLPSARCPGSCALLPRGPGSRARRLWGPSRCISGRPPPVFRAAAVGMGGDIENYIRGFSSQ